MKKYIFLLLSLLLLIGCDTFIEANDARFGTTKHENSFCYKALDSKRIIYADGWYEICLDKYMEAVKARCVNSCYEKNLQTDWVHFQRCADEC